MDMNKCIFALRKKLDILLLSTVTFENKNGILHVKFHLI